MTVINHNLSLLCMNELMEEVRTPTKSISTIPPSPEHNNRDELMMYGKLAIFSSGQINIADMVEPKKEQRTFRRWIASLLALV